MKGRWFVLKESEGGKRDERKVGLGDLVGLGVFGRCFFGIEYERVRKVLVGKR